ncbi:MAG: M56/M15 family metallopeptidase [Flavitalea sp.]
MFFSVVLFLSTLLIRKIYWINAIKRSYPSTVNDKVTIVETDLRNAPFSFLSTIYWRDDISMESRLGQHIMKHEMTHVRLKHSLDKLFIQIILILFWINPFYWLINKELSLQHEFAADASATEGDSHLLSLMLLQTHFSPVFPQIVHPFFNSSIKQRLSMINLPGKPNFAFFRKTLIAPILCGAVILFSYQSNPNSGTLLRSEKNIKVILDAGHGGFDNGAVARDGTKEKDLVLQITKRIAELAPEYGISILPIRTGDEYIDIKQKLIKSDKLGGDLYVSIHVNSLLVKQVWSTTGYSVIVSAENQKPEKSKELASAIISRFQKSGIALSLDEVSSVYVLKENQLPAVLLECGDINNANHVNRITNKSSLESMSRNILSGIADYSNKK